MLEVEVENRYGLLSGIRTKEHRVLSQGMQEQGTTRSTDSIPCGLCVVI